MKKPTIIALICILIVLFGGFILLNKSSKRQNPAAQNGKLQVVASFYPMYFFASQIGGDKANVVNITPAGAEPHNYEPTTQDIVRIMQSKLLVLNGGGTGAPDAWANKLQDQLKNSNIIVVTAGDNIATKTMEENGSTMRDPHVWLSPPLAIQEIQNIEKGFEEADPANKSFYEANASALEDKLKNLDAAFKNGLQSCQQTDFVTSHAAFAYLAEQYGITQVPISGLSPDAEPSIQTLAMITNLIKAKNIKYVFFESLVSPKLSDTIANETGAKTLVLDPLEGIPDNALMQGADYFSIMNQNLANLKIALQCK